MLSMPVAEPGGDFHHHRIQSGGQRRQAELLHHYQRIRVGVVEEHRDGVAPAQHLPGSQARHFPVEAAVAEADQVERGPALPDAAARFDFDIGMRGQGSGVRWWHGVSIGRRVRRAHPARGEN